MGGVVLETLSSKKLGLITLLALGVQILCFVMGGRYPPRPSMAQVVGANVCVVPYTRDWPRKEFVYLKGRGVTNTCNIGTYVDDISKTKQVADARSVVLLFEYPLMKENLHLEFSSWFQFNSGSLQFRIRDTLGHSGEVTMSPRTDLRLLVRLGNAPAGGNSTDYVEIASTPSDKPLHRQLDCTLPGKGQMYDCQDIDLYYFGHSHFKKMILNIVIPTDLGANRLDVIEDVSFVWISQTGGFMFLWTIFKTFFFVVLSALSVWYMNRLRQLDRKVVLLEQMNVALAVASFILNVPVDWLVPVVRMPYFQVWVDIRQGIFNATLTIYWMVFIGEHMVDDERRNHIKFYKKHLIAIIIAVLCLFVFELCERGYQIHDPFSTVWGTELGEKLAYAVLGLAGVASVVYFLILMSMIIRVIIQLWRKRAAIPSLVSRRRLYFKNIIYRFTFLMVFTLVCAAMSVAGFIAGSYYESSWQFDDEYQISFEYMSSFQFGVYGSWAIYCGLMLILYAPSHKKYVGANLQDDETDEIVELTAMPGSASQVAGLISKTSTD